VDQRELHQGIELILAMDENGQLLQLFTDQRFALGRTVDNFACLAVADDGSWFGSNAQFFFLDGLNQFDEFQGGRS